MGRGSSFDFFTDKQARRNEATMSKKRTQIFQWGYGLLLGAVVALFVRAEKSPLPPDPKILVGAWFGLDRDRLIFCRLELNSDGKGFCSTVYVNDPAELYVIKNWSLDRFNLNMDLVPVDEKAEPIRLKGGGGPPELVLEIGGMGEKTWKRELRLFKEQEFLSKNERAKERIAKYKTEQSVKSDK